MLGCDESGSTYPSWLGGLGIFTSSGRERLVGDLTEQVGDDVQPAALLVVVVHDVPGRPPELVAAIIASRARR